MHTISILFLVQMVCKLQVHTKFIFLAMLTLNSMIFLRLWGKLVQNNSAFEASLSEKTESNDKWDSFDHKYSRKPYPTTCTLWRHSWRKIPRDRRDLCLQTFIAWRRIAMAKRSSLGPTSCWFINTSEKTTMKAHLMSIFWCHASSSMSRRRKRVRVNY